MKRITYTFADREQKEIEVSEEVAEALEEMDRTEHASDEFKRYHCPYSIDAMVYEGSEYSSTKMSPEVLTERAELTQQINKCFDKLTSTQKRRIQMLSNGLTLREIARTENKDIKTIRESINAARKKFLNNF